MSNTMPDPFATNPFTPTPSASSHEGSAKNLEASLIANSTSEIESQLAGVGQATTRLNWESNFQQFARVSSSKEIESAAPLPGGETSGLHNAQEMQDGGYYKTPTKRLSPPKAGGEQLKLAPSPTQDTTPTHRSTVEAKTQDKMLDLIRKEASTRQTDMQIANVRAAAESNVPSSVVDKTQADAQLAPVPAQRKAQSKLVPPPLNLDVGKKVGSDSPGQTSPRKKIFNKLAFGIPALKANPTAASKEDPVKTNVMQVVKMPLKAGQVFGTQSLPGRTPQKCTSMMTSEGMSSHSDVSPYSNEQELENLTLKTESDSDSPYSKAAKQGKQGPASTPGGSLQYPEPRLRTLNARISSGNLTEPSTSLRFYDDEVPPTPPSKTDLYRKVEKASKQSVTAAKAAEHRSTNDTAAGEHNHAKIGSIPKFPAQLVEQQTDTQSVYGTFGMIDPSSPSPNPHGHENVYHRSMLTAGSGSQGPDSSTSLFNRSESMNDNGVSNKKLRRAQHLILRSQVPNSATNVNSQVRERETSNSTSASVPLFFDGPLGDLPTGVSSSATSNGSESVLISAIEKAIDQKLNATAQELGASIERLSGHFHGRLPGLDRSIYAVKGQMRRLEKRWDEMEKRVDRVEGLARQTEAHVEWLHNQMMRMDQMVTASAAAGQQLQGGLREHESAIMGLRQEVAGLRLEMERQQRQGRAMAGYGAIGPSEVVGRQHPLHGHGGGVGGYGVIEARSAAGHYFSSLGQERGEPDIMQHPYFNGSNH